MFLEALRLLDEDARTKVIVLVSKPPHADVLAKIALRIHAIKKPVAAVFLGIDAEMINKSGMIPRAQSCGSCAGRCRSLEGPRFYNDCRSLCRTQRRTEGHRTKRIPEASIHTEVHSRTFQRRYVLL